MTWAHRWRAIPVLVLAIVACDEDVFVKGVVRGPTGAPLQGATVTLTSPGRPPDTARTATDGSFDVGMIGADPVKAQVSFEKEGFKRIDRSLEGRPQWAMDITLSPETAK